MNTQRKKPVRLFKGLVGLQSEEIPKPKTENIAPASPAPVQSVTEIQAQIITAYDNKVKKKRGRPAIGNSAMTAAERKQRSRARLAEKSARSAVNKAYLDEIQTAMHEHRDSAGRLHGETSGGDSISALLAQADNPNAKHKKAMGCDPRVYERGGYGRIKETASQWANRQNFNVPAHWNASEKEAYAEELAKQCCVEEFYCKFGDFASLNEEDVADHFCTDHYGHRFFLKREEGADPELITLPPPDDHCIEKYRCLFGDFISEKYDDVLSHFLQDHKGYIRSMIRFHEPRCIKTPRTFSTRDLNFVTPLEGNKDDV
jgi:hypothetical protein